MKRFYTLLILYIGILGTFMAQGADVNGINYKLWTATAEVSGSNCVKGAVEIPESIIVDEVSYKVTSIGAEAFSDCNELTSITIGRNVTKISPHAFKNCSALNSITIPNSVTLVWNYAFEGCSSLTKVNYLGTMDEWLKIGITIPTPFDLYLNGELLTNVKMSSSDNTFSNCKSIKSVEIGNSVTYIDKNAFSGCIGLTTITIPNHVTSIGDGAFSNCSSLASITIPISVTSIGNNVFSNCSGLTKVNYLGSVDEWLDSDFAVSTNNPTYYAKDLYINGRLLTDVKISSADSIKNFAFYNCKSIKSVEIGNSVAYIDENAFSGCSGLTSVIWNIKNYPGFRLGTDSPFYGFNITSFTFGNEVECVPANICYGQEYLKEVTIGTNVISIGRDAFKNCFALTSVIWNAKNCQDGGPFYPSGAKNVTLVLGTEVEHIPQNLCFDNFSKVNYLGSVNKWVDLDFNSQGSNPTYYTKDLYINGELLTDVKISSADSIKKYAFHNCKSIKSLEIGKSVTYIGESAFSGCSGLVKVNYLGSVDKWAQINFASLYANPTNNTNDLYINDELLTEVRISSADKIKKYAFYNCKSLKNVEMSDTLTTVDEYAFYNCSDLTSVSIGNGVTIIGNNAFNNCSRLNTIVSYPTAVPTAYNNSFKNYNATLYVPCDAYDNYSSDDVFGQFKVINCITAEEEGGTIPTPTPTPNPEPEPEPTPGGEITLYYVNKTGWSAVNAYVWDNATGTPIFAWSGEPATKLDKTVDGNEVYSYTFGSSLADRIIFNNGNAGEGNQTQDLTFDASKPYFYDGVWYASLTFDTNGGGTVDPTPDPKPEPTPDTTVAPLYIKLALNNWVANDTYKLTSADGNYYVANYSAGNEITISGNFKVSNEDWSVNYGGGFLIEAGKPYMLVPNAENLDTAGKIKASKVEFTLSTGVLKITGTTSSNEFDITKDQGVAFVVNPRGASPVYVPLTHSYNAEYNTAQYTGTYTVTELGVTAKIGGLTNFNVIDYGTNGQPVMPKFVYDMVKGAYNGFTIEGDYKVGDVLNIVVLFDKDWNSSILINVQEAGTTPTPTPNPDPKPEPEEFAFFVAGNGGSDATGIWCNGIEWSSVGVETANNMTDADKDGIYEITFNQVPAGTWNFKVVGATEGWMGSDYLDTENSSAGYTTVPNDGNIGFTLNAHADVTIKFNTLTGKIILTTPSGNFGRVTIDYFSVANTDECLVENRFTAANNNTLKYTVDIQVSEESGFGYAAFRILGNCNYAVYENSLLVEVTESGKYEVTIVFNGDYETPEFTITYVKQGSTTEPDTPVDPDTPVNPDEPDTPVKPEPDPDPVVAIKNLMIQPFEQVLPKATTSTVATFTLQNANTATVSIEGLDADFFEIGEQNIGNGECSVSIVFKPIVIGVYYATLVVTTDDEVSLSIDFAAVCGDETFEPGDVPELNPDPVNPGTPDDEVSVDEVSAVMIYAKEGTVYSEVDFEIYDLAGVNVTKLNGSLQGVYIVKTAEGNRLVSVW